MQPFSRGQALVIGVGTYGDPRWDAPTASRDAQGIYDTLIGAGGYGPGQAELLLDAQATRQGVLLALRRLADRSAQDSVALISITSHGATGEDGLYTLATSEARFAAGERIARGTGLNVADLARALREIPARQLLLILNACFAGDVGREYARQGIGPEDGLSTGALLPNDAGDELLATGDGRAILTAGRPGQRSYFKPEERHSYFGQAVIDALRGSAITAARGAVGLYELYEGVYRQVRAATAQRLGEAQEPVLTVVQNVGPFVVASATGAVSDSAISQRPASDLPVREVEREVIAAIGQGATAIKAEAGSTVTVDNSKLIDFGGATVMGGISIGNVAKGDIININSPGGAGSPADAPPDPLRDLPLLKARVEVARNVDADSRDEAAGKIDLALKALSRGDSVKARLRIDEALELLRAMNNGYINSVVRKLEAIERAL